MPITGQSFWTEYGPNRFETLAFGVAGGVLLASRIGVGFVVLIAIAVAAASYVIRRYLVV